MPAVPVTTAGGGNQNVMATDPFAQPAEALAMIAPGVPRPQRGLRRNNMSTR
jgi:hypothetical protein